MALTVAGRTGLPRHPFCLLTANVDNGAPPSSTAAD
jgi:hypothetical protein